MSGKKFGFLALAFVLVSAVFVPALLTGIASSECSVVNSLTVVQLFHTPNDYKWQGNWDPRFDNDWQTHYGITYVRDCDARCDRCDVRDNDRSVARDCDRCTPCPSITGYRCDLFSCAWVRDYGCTSCPIR
ncbi:MAG: hypothetical protein ACLQVJ_02465 [Syntrophobacteraceae bacterium]